MLETLKLEHFSPLVGSQFSVTSGTEEPMELRLQEASPIEAPATETRSQFSLLFVGPETPVLEQQIVPLRHEELGELSIFLVPIGLADAGFQYEAVFT